MAFIALQTLIANTTSFTSTGATQITLPSATIAYILAQLGASGNYTTISIADGVNQEFMNITGITSGAADVTRAQAGSSAVPLAKGATVRFVWTQAAILAIAPGGTVTCTGAGATNVTGGPAYTIGSQFTQVLGGAGITVSGVYPNFTVASTVPAGPTGATGPAGPAVIVTASGIAVAAGGPTTYNVDVPAPAFVAGSGITITGTWPAITITNTRTQGGTGTVTNLVAGAGITISGGTPTINPTVSLTAVGPGAGTYGGVTLNAYGQITAIAGSFATSITGSTSGLTVANPSLGAYTVNASSAGHSQQGLVALAPATNAGSNDVTNDTQAVTPKGINAVVAALVVTPATIAVAGAQTPLLSASYTNTISGFNIPVAVAAGKSAIVDIYVETNDPSNPTVVQTVAFGLYNSGSLLAGNSSIIGGSRNLKYLVTGPLTATLSVKTTALVGTQVIGSYYASVIGN
jgi:hypothetical protein